jgi:hypothetical protein
MRIQRAARGAAGVLALTLAAAGCATTSFTSTWKAPDAGPVSLGGKKVAAMMVTPNDGTRRAAEDVLARELSARGAQGVPSYSLFDGRDFKDEDVVRRAMQQAGIDGVVVIRAVGSDKEVSYTPGTWTTRPVYRVFWGGYYRYGWSSVYEPGYLRTDTVVTVETLVYSMTDDKLIWAGASRTTNPSGLDALVKELAGKVAGQMRQEGVLR